MKDLQEIIELIGGFSGGQEIAIPRDGRKEHLIPFVSIFDEMPVHCYVYKRIAESSVFGYCGISRLPSPIFPTNTRVQE